MLLEAAAGFCLAARLTFECHGVYRLVLARFTQTIVRCRPIGQIGAEQVSAASDHSELVSSDEEASTSIADPPRFAVTQDLPLASGPSPGSERPRANVVR